ESYCTTERVWLAAVTAAAVSLPTTKVSFAPDSGAAGEEAERFTAISAAASGDQPSGSRPASDCPPTDVAVTGVPGVSAAAGTATSTAVVSEVAPPCFRVRSAPPVCSAPRRVRRMSIGTTPTPAGTTTCRHTFVYPLAVASMVYAPSASDCVE